MLRIVAFSLVVVLAGCRGDHFRRGDARTLRPTGITDGLKNSHKAPLLAFQQPPPQELQSTDDFRLEGWAVDPVNKDCGAGVEIAVDGVPFATDHVFRPDVASALRVPIYRESGFSWSVPAQYLAHGDHVFTVRVIATTGDYYLESTPTHFTVD